MRFFGVGEPAAFGEGLSRYLASPIPLRIGSAMALQQPTMPFYLSPLVSLGPKVGAESWP